MQRWELPCAVLLQTEETWQSPPGAAPSPETSYYCPGGRRPRRIHTALELPHLSPVGKEPGSFLRRLAFYCFRRLFESSSHLVWGRLSLSNRHPGFGRVGEKRLERAICRNLPPAQAAQGDVSMPFCRLHLPCFSVILWFIL